jgi:hypothetical protein
MKFNFLPSREFAEKAKGRFLAVFDARYPASLRPRASEFVLAMRALAIVLAVAAVVLGGASVYADTTNVAADNPLYPLKRLSESVQLALTKSQAKPQFEASRAARRADEITELEARHPTSTLLPILASDLDDAVNTSISAAEKGDNREKTNENGQENATSQKQQQPQSQSRKGLMEVCGTLQSFLGVSSTFRNDPLNNSRTLRYFDDRCGKDEDSEVLGASTMSTTTTGVSTTTPVRFQDKQKEDRGQKNEQEQRQGRGQEQESERGGRLNGAASTTSSGIDLHLDDDSGF